MKILNFSNESYNKYDDLLLCKTTSRGYIYWGKNNMTPQYYVDAYNNISLLHSIIDTYKYYMLEELKDSIQYKDLSLILQDYLVFGVITLQRVGNKYNRVDPRRIRCNEDKDMFYYSDFCRNRPVSVYNKIIELDSNSIIWIDNNSIYNIYPQPFYGASLKACDTYLEVLNYHNNAIKNNFAASAIISFNNGIPSEEEQSIIEKKINDKFSGTSNSNRSLIIFNDSKDNSVEVNRLDADNTDSRFISLLETTKENILTACKINPVLLGNNVQTGFSKQEFNELKEFFKETIIQPMCAELLAKLKEVLV